MNRVILSPCQLYNLYFLLMLKTDHPDPPSNLSLLPTPLEPFTISWIPPFTLPGVTISYIVNVINLNTSRVLHSSELNTPSFNFNGREDGSPCDVYQFTVTARNAAGRSDPSDTLTASLPSGKLLLEIYNVNNLNILTDLPTLIST